ncbi:MAG TPA: family 78 glycoside hydrolase catalytic domain [Clostridiales bacterium]|nr:family 78 glycoside hydrolase catalytic domain [Clostridiales bacterium]
MDFRFVYPEQTCPDKKQLQPASYLRKTFVLDAPVLQATLHMTALGVYQGYCNGEKLDDSLFNPGFTEYHSRVQYQTYDITERLRVGTNVIAAVLGDGWYRGCLSINNNRCFFGRRIAFACVLELRDASGTHILFTDESWLATQDGPVCKNDMKTLEQVDARKELTGWTSPDFNDSDWHPCVKGSYKGCVIPQEGERITEHEVFSPVLLHAPNGETVLDFRQNHAGYPAFTVTGNAGHTVTLTMSETLDENGNFTMKNLVTEGSESFAKPVGQQLIYTLRAGTQTYKPQFLIAG